MHRTTLLLSEELRREAQNLARRQGITLSELIRRKLATSVATKSKNALAGDPLFRPARLMISHEESDVSARHDDYIYGPPAKRRSRKTPH